MSTFWGKINSAVDIERRGQIDVDKDIVYLGLKQINKNNVDGTDALCARSVNWYNGQTQSFQRLE